MPTGNLAQSPEFESARANLQAAREQYTLLVEKYAYLTGVASKNLEAEYMLKIGKKEHELFSCQVEILRLKREIALFQAARNRGDTVCAKEVKKIIEKEFAEYQQQLEAQKEKLENARKYFFAGILPPEESKKLKNVYRDIVRKLHPDLNPDLPIEASELWNQVQYAYEMNDWDKILLLAEIADELLEGREAFTDSINSLTRLQEELEKTNQKISLLEKQIKDIEQQVPFVYAALLQDPAAVSAKRSELDAQINLCRERIRDLQELRNSFEV